MRLSLRLLSSVWMCASLVLVGFGQSAPTPAPVQPAANAFANEALIFERYDTIYRMNADGTGERDLHVVMRVQSNGAAQQFGVLAFSYASANETPKIEFVRVHKADGTVVETPPSDAIDMPAEVTRQAPLYSDLKEKHIPVRSLAAGDTLDYQIDTAINQPEVKDQFWGANHFTVPGTLVVLSENLTLEFPSGKYVQVWSPNHKPQVSEQNGQRIYKWSEQQLIPAPRQTGDDTAKPVPPKDPDEDSQGRKIPSVAWTTFHSWPEVGDWYRGLALSQAKPNDAIRARADEITANAKTPEDQVRAIYNFVSTQNRYVGIDFGIGRYQPHTAQQVLSNAYGDCKDKDTLLEALLDAKGFSTAPALIGAGIAPVPEVPSPAVFNHVITTVNLPSGQIWLDSTPGSAPFQYLAAIIRDQEALVIPPAAPASLQSTPVSAPYPFTARLEAVGTLDKDGKLNAKMTATYHDDDELIVRQLARTVAPSERDQASQYISSATGFGGTTSNTAFRFADDFAQPIVMTYDYSRHPFGDWDSMRIVPLFPALEFAPLSSETTAPISDIELGAPRTLTAISRIKLPDGFHTNLPDPIHVKTSYATFDKTYHFDDGEIVAERTIVVLKKKIDKADWKDYLAFTKQIGLSGEAWIQLFPASKPIKITSVTGIGLPAKPAGSDTGKTKTIQNLPILQEPPVEKKSETTAAAPSPELSGKSVGELMEELRDKMRAYDWVGARQVLDAVKAKDPNHTGLWSAYGFLAMQGDHDRDAAIEDFRKELVNDPDNPAVLGWLVNLMMQNHQQDEAREVLQRFVQAHPDNVLMAGQLGYMQTQAKDDEGALKTYEAAAEHNPDNRQLRIREAESLFRLHRDDEASAAAKSALDGVDDPEILNDAAYTLSETGHDLPIAEDASRKSIANLEERSASITTDQVNQQAFNQATLMLAAWDTLGWILYQEGKYDEALLWLAPAWRATLLAESGSHLGQTYEKLGKKDQAAASFLLAQDAINKTTTPNVVDDIKAGLERTEGAKAAKVKPHFVTDDAEDLQKLRSFRVKRPSGADGWGTFRLEVTTAGVIEAQQVSGEQKLSAAIKPALLAMKFPELLPPASKAHLLRSAVVSCSMGPTCDVVFVPDAGIQTEQR